MLVFIPYQDDHHGGEELRFSIRSLEKFFSSMTNVVVIGDKPKWYKGEHIFARDIDSRKEFSMFYKVMLAAQTLKVDKFLYTTDDHFVLKPIYSDLPNYYSGTCEYMALTNASGRYRRQYKNCPPGWLNYDIHVPIVMKPFTWSSYSKETDTPIKSTYANQAGIEGTELKDCKFKNPHSYQQIKEIIADRQFFSTSPHCMNTDMFKVLNELYSDKSKFEL